MHLPLMSCNFFISLLLFCSLPLAAIDIIKVNKGHSDKDSRHLYNWQVIKRALQLTKPDYGDYKLKVTGEAIPNHQRLRELSTGKYLNVAMTVTNSEWEDKITPIRIPIRFEALKYRLLLIRKKDAQRFKNVQTLNDLRLFSSGVRQSWTTKEVLLKNDFITLPAYSYEALFAMLNKGRFDFILRGVHEIYPEFESRKDQLSNIAIEPRLVVEVPNSHYYVFVSPQEPVIEQRLYKGLTLMTENGELKQLFDKYYGPFFTRAALDKRIHIPLSGIN